MLVVWREHKIARDDDAHGKTRPDGQRRLNIEIASDDLLAGLIEALGAAAAQGLDERVFIACRSELGSDAENGGERGGAGEAQPMMIEFIFEAGVATGVGAWLTLQHDRLAIGKNEPVPNEKHGAASLSRDLYPSRKSEPNSHSVDKDRHAYALQQFLKEGLELQRLKTQEGSVVGGGKLDVFVEDAVLVGNKFHDLAKHPERIANAAGM